MALILSPANERRLLANPVVQLVAVKGRKVSKAAYVKVLQPDGLDTNSWTGDFNGLQRVIILCCCKLTFL